MQEPDNSLSDFLPKRRKIFYGWWIVVAAALLNILAGGTFVYGLTVFFNPIRNAFGWGAAVTSVAFTLGRLESGLLEAIAGFLVDRVGPRKLMLCGWSVVGLGFLLMSNVDSLWMFYGSFLLMAVGMSFAAFIVIFATIANWFEKKRSRAMTVVVTGYGLSGTLVPLVASAVGAFGWRETLAVMAILVWIIGLPLSSLMRHKPSQYGYLPDGASSEAVDSSQSGSPNETGKGSPAASAADFTLKEAVKTRAFWLLAAVSFFQFFAVSAVMVHTIPFLESIEVSSKMAATVVTGVTVSSLIGRLGFGFIGDFANKRHLMAIGLALQTIGIFIFFLVGSGREWVIIPFLLTYAPGFGATIPLRPALQADYFGTKSFGAIMGIMTLVAMVGGLASPIIAGWIFDVTGSYHTAWLLFALVSLPAVPLILLAKPPAAR
ncbi:MAG: MFS transporter [Dehalococcoidales bacterium]|nr:MAG: MFS transporter [Dehalococcoidales bacterium]